MTDPLAIIVDETTVVLVDAAPLPPLEPRNAAPSKRRNHDTEWRPDAAWLAREAAARAHHDRLRAADQAKVEKRFQAARRELDREIAAVAAGDTSAEQRERGYRARQRLERIQQAMVAHDPERAAALDREADAARARLRHALEEEGPRARRAQLDAELAALDSRRAPRLRDAPRPPFAAGTIVRSTYRVPPFLSDEQLEIVEMARVGGGWRARVRSAVPGRSAAGWLDADTLIPVDAHSVRARRAPARRNADEADDLRAGYRAARTQLAAFIATRAGVTVEDVVQDRDGDIAVSGTRADMHTVAAWIRHLARSTGREVSATVDVYDDPDDPDFAVCRIKGLG